MGHPRPPAPASRSGPVLRPVLEWEPPTLPTCEKLAPVRTLGLCGLPIKENSNSAGVDKNSLKRSPDREPRARVPRRVPSRPSLTDLSVLTQRHRDVGHFLAVLRAVGPCYIGHLCFPRKGRGLTAQLWISLRRPSGLG